MERIGPSGALLLASPPERLRNGDTPRVVVTDPLQAHVDHMPKWTDAEMHNMTAYLASLK